MSQLSLKDDMTRFLSTTLEAEVEVDYIQRVSDPFNEVSKASPPDIAWYVQGTIKQEGEENEVNTWQVGEKDGTMKIYCTWDYALFEEER